MKRSLGGLVALALGGCSGPFEKLMPGGVGTLPDGGFQCASQTEAPDGRSDFAAAIDEGNGRLIMFGGDTGLAVQCNPNPAFSGETWFYKLGCNTWSRFIGQGPSPRARVASAWDSNRKRLLIYGGRYRAGGSGSYTTYAETWAFDATSDTWSQLPTTGSPIPVSSAGAVFDPTSDALIVFGGNASNNGLAFTPNNQIWSLSMATNGWTQLTPTSSAVPAAREFHGMTLDAVRRRVVVFSGGDASAFTGPFLLDTWAFDLNSKAWTQLTTPPGLNARIRTALAPDSSGTVVMFGGHDDQQMGERNDTWSLGADDTWTKQRAGDVLNNTAVGTCSFPPDFTTPDLGSPERREGHAFLFDSTRGHQLMLGGRGDCGTLMDVWTFDLASATWTRKTLSGGETCVRSGRTNCTSLCN